MADRDIVFPPRDLGGRAQEWGRTLESVYRDVALDTETLKQSLQGLNRSTASSLQDLSNQILDLKGRTSYSAGEEGLFVNWSSTAPTNTVFGPAITFTLTEPRLVMLTYQLRAQVNAFGVSNSASSTLQVGTQVDDSYTANLDARSEGWVRAFADPGQASSPLQSVTALSSWRLPAGTHTARGMLVSRAISAPGSSSGAGEVQNPYLRVDVLQPI